ncbi:Sigma-70 region 2 [Tannerella forsythia KS16]|jgi:RNA polymerase sigma factor, sigma-70 family|uniref:RNA polymerase sigma factor n=1 Tax=Tannerella forsythia TaxID=28112 RepID=UPI000618C914|nr:sigma-70 family RNA polymerase sigma factor [Tannerella forsythia]PDP70342.1 sigma-70 family RNA polymerase sigma factor [Tannerella forsythia]BAR51502.1 Sigma-70 region 2 [Tannerella forsythia KS16]
MTAESFKQRYFSLHPRLYRVAFTILKNEDDAADVLQDAYCKLWDNRERLGTVDHPEAFCVTMVKRLCLDLLRSPKSAQKSAVEEAFIIDDQTPCEALEQKEMLGKVRMWMQRLPEKQRRVLELRGYADCSLEEIGRIMGETSANVRVLLSRARNTLRMKITN